MYRPWTVRVPDWLLFVHNFPEKEKKCFPSAFIHIGLCENDYLDWLPIRNFFSNSNNFWFCHEFKKAVVFVLFCFVCFIFLYFHQPFIQVFLHISYHEIYDFFAACIQSRSCNPDLLFFGCLVVCNFFGGLAGTHSQSYLVTFRLQGSSLLLYFCWIIVVFMIFFKVN